MSEGGSRAFKEMAGSGEGAVAMEMGEVGGY